MYRIRDECIRLTRKTGWVGCAEGRKSDGISGEMAELEMPGRTPGRTTNEDVYGRSERGSGLVSGGVHGVGRGLKWRQGIGCGRP